MDWQNNAALVLGLVMQYLKSFKTIPNKAVIGVTFVLGAAIYCLKNPALDYTSPSQFFDWAVSGILWASGILGLGSAAGHFIPTLATDSKEGK
jgi:hypothetical protein